MAMRRSSKTVEPFAQKNSAVLLSIGVGVIVAVCLLIFFSAPLFNSPTPRWTLLFAPTLNPDFIRDVWFGVDLPQAQVTGERFLAFGIGCLLLVSAYFLGRFFMFPVTRAVSLTRAETIFFSVGLGLIVSSTILCVMGILGYGNLHLAPSVLVLLCTGLLGAFFSFFSKKVKQVRKNNPCKSSDKTASETKELKTRSFDRCVLIFQTVLFVFFISFYAFSATQPIFEYDAVEYHVQSAREIFETGAISFFPNNVYANMPLGSEMFYLAGFNIMRDIGCDPENVLRLGSLVGKVVLTSFALLTALGIGAFCVRFLRSATVGVWSAIVFLSFPGVFNVFNCGLNDSLLSFALLGALYVVLLVAQQSLNADSPIQFKNLLYLVILLGTFLGFAASIKYTGVVFVCIPAAIGFAAVLWKPRFFSRFFDVYLPDNQKANEIIQSSNCDGQQSLLHSANSVGPYRVVLLLTLLIATALLIGGGWYIRNATATGNPVYPLAFHVFGDKTGQWTESINQRWEKAHSSSEFGASAFGKSIASSFWKDEEASPFYLIAGVLGLLFVCARLVARVIAKSKRPTSRLTEKYLVLLLALMATYWLGWYFLTHRLARFLLPIAPLTALTLGIFIAWSLRNFSVFGRIFILAAIFLSTGYSGLLIDMQSLGRMAPLRALEKDPMRFTAESVFFNEHLELLASPPGAESNTEQPLKKLLLVGEAKAFMYRVPILYSTCWNDSPLALSLEGAVSHDASGSVSSIVNPEIIRENLKNMGVGFILADFSELARFRSKGNYGYNNPEIDSTLFQLLVDARILEPFHSGELPQPDNQSVQVFRIRENSGPNL